MKRRTWELLGITIYFFLCAVMICYFHLNYLVSTTISFVPLSLYLTLRKPEFFRHIVLYSIAVAIPVVFIVDYIATVSHSWWETTMFSFRIFGVIPLETVIWAFCYLYLIIYFYEYFLDRHLHKVSFPPQMKYLAGLFLMILALFGFLLVVYPQALIINYFYAKFIVATFILVPAVILAWHPVLIRKVLLQGVYFIILQLFMEFAALQNGIWGFSGNYIGAINAFGLKLPLEELAWIILCVPTMICLYEVFADDGR